MTLLVHYKFYETLYDNSGNDYHATNSGVLFTKQIINWSASFGGSEKYFTIPSDIDGAYTVFSLCLKVKLDTLPSIEGHDYYLTSFDTDDISIWVDTADDKIYATTHNGTTLVTSSYSTALVVNVCYDVQFVYDGVNQYLYIDDVLVDTDVRTGTITLAGTNYVGKYPALVRNPEGYIDEFKFYDEAISLAEINKNFRTQSTYDVWINNKSYQRSINLVEYSNALDAVTGRFYIKLGDRAGSIKGEVDRGDDVMIFHKGNLVFRGGVETIDPNQRVSLVITGRSYMSILLERFAVNKSYTAQTRQYIIQDLITTYLSSDFGPIYFTTTGIEEITTATFDKQYDYVSLAEIFFTLAKEEGAQLYITNSITLPLVITYETRDSIESGIVLDYNTQSNTTSGHQLRKFNLETDSRQVKNVFTVYTPASSKKAASVRDNESIAAYGEKKADPITDVNATTISLARERAAVEIAKWKTPVTNGVLMCRDHEDLQSSKVLALTISKLALTEEKFLIVQSTHRNKPTGVELRISNNFKEAGEVLSDLIKKSREYTFRDADPESPVSEYLTYDFSQTMVFTVTIKEVLASNIDMKIGTMKIGTSQIGSSLAAGTVTLYEDLVMTTTTAGKNLMRDLFTGTGTALDGTNAYMGSGTNSTTHTVASTTLGTEVGTRKQADASPDVGTSKKATWTFTNSDTNIPAGTIVREIALFNASSVGDMPAVFNINAITKVTGNDLIFEITGEWP